MFPMKCFQNFSKTNCLQKQRSNVNGNTDSEVTPCVFQLQYFCSCFFKNYLTRLIGISVIKNKKKLKVYFNHLVLESIHGFMRGANNKTDDSLPCLHSYITSALKIQAKCKYSAIPCPEIHLAGATVLSLTNCPNNMCHWKSCPCYTWLRSGPWFQITLD